MWVWRQLVWTFRVCSLVLKDAVSIFRLPLFLPPLVTLTAFPLLQIAGAAAPMAAVVAFVLGYALQLWMGMESTVARFLIRRTPMWIILAISLGLVALLLFLQSPVAALRVMSALLALRIVMLLIDLSDGKAWVARRICADELVRPHDAAITRVLLLRDIAFILLAETVIQTGSMALILTLLAFWRILHLFLDRAVVTSVALAGHFSGGR